MNLPQTLMKKHLIGNSLNAFILLGLFGLIGSVHALEPLKSATDQVVELRSKRLLSKIDKDQDGKIAKSENEDFWKKHVRYDKNKDEFLSSEELKASFNHSMQAPGKELLNVQYKQTSRGGVYLDVYFPNEDVSKAKPVVFFTHGGGWAAGDKLKATQHSFAQVHKAWLKEGFVVVSVGYRLASKDGGTIMRDCVIDCKDAMRFISAHKEALGVDSNKFYTFGDSAGGHLAMMLLHSPPSSLTGDEELKKFSYETVAGVSWYGPCDFQDVQLFNHDDRPNFRDRFGARIVPKNSKLEGKAALYKEMSPVSYLQEGSAPLLMIQGDRDTTIPVKQAHRMQEALKTINAPVEVMLIKNAGHNWRSVDSPISPTRAEIVKSTVNFILKHQK